MHHDTRSCCTSVLQPIYNGGQSAQFALHLWSKEAKMVRRSLARFIAAGTVATSVLVPLAMGSSSLARADSGTTIHKAPVTTPGWRPTAPTGIQPFSCGGQQRFSGPYTVDGTGAYFYLTDNYCSSGTYFQVQLYVPSSHPWTACDTKGNGSPNCRSGNGTCNPCYSPGQIDSPGNMYGTANVSGVQVTAGPI